MRNNFFLKKTIQSFSNTEQKTTSKQANFFRQNRRKLHSTRPKIHFAEENFHKKFHYLSTLGKKTSAYWRKFFGSVVETACCMSILISWVFLKNYLIFSLRRWAKFPWPFGEFSSGMFVKTAFYARKGTLCARELFEIFQNRFWTLGRQTINKLSKNIGRVFKIHCAYPKEYLG